MHSFVRENQLGKGGFSIVHRATSFTFPSPGVALKQISKQRLAQNDLVKLIENEVSIHSRCEHPNIVQYLGMEQTDQKLCIFLEYVPGGSLKDLIMNFGPLNTNLLRVYTRQMLLGLEYLHHRGIAHRDLKAANILITNTGVIKIGKQFALNL